MLTPGGPLRPASFKGVGFLVRSDARPFPRSLHVDKFPASDRWEIHDLGREPSAYQVDAYIADEANAYQRCRDLENALASPGPGLLILPARKPVTAWAWRPQSVFESTALGIFAFRIEFLNEAKKPGAPVSTGLAERMVSEASLSLGSLAQSAGGLLAQAASQALGVSVYEAAAFASRAASALDTLRGLADAATAVADVTTAVQSASDWLGYAGIVDALATAGDAGLTVLEQIAGSITEGPRP